MWPAISRLSKAELWAPVRLHVAQILAELKTKPRAELVSLVENERHESFQVGKVSFQINVWAQRMVDGRLAVAVDAWRNRFLGWSQSTVVGFHLGEDGSISDMKSEDFWEHGY
jgi:hypothetical protein